MNNGWTESTLGEIADYWNGYAFKPTDFTAEGLPVIRIKQLLNPEEPVDRFDEELGDRYKIRNGDIIFSWSGTLAVRRWDRGEAWLNQHLFRVDPRPGVTSGWLRYVLDYSIAQLEGLTHGTTMKHITKAKLVAFRVLVPPVAVQKRIVDLMSSIDAAIRAGRERLELGEMALGALREAAWASNSETAAPLSEMASIEASMVDPKEVGYRTLKHVGVAQIEKDTGRVLDVQTAEEEGVISAKFLFTPEDIVYSKIRPNLRKVAMPGFAGLCSADAYPLRPTSYVDPHFLREMLLSEPFTSAAIARSGRTKMPKINRTELFSIDIPNPASEVQARLGRLFLANRESLESTRYLIDQLSELREQVLRVLLSGEHAMPESYDHFLEDAS